MLQQTCRNIGNDMSSKAKEHSPKSRHASHPYKNARTSPNTPPKSGREKSRKGAAYHDRQAKQAANNVPASSAPMPTIAPSSPSVVPSMQLPPTPSVADYNQFAVSQYQLMHQKLLYQTELEKLQLSTTNLNNYLPYSGTFLDPMSVSPPASNPAGQTDFAKLAAFFYNKLEQRNSAIPNQMTATTEALQNYRKILLERSSTALPPFSQELKPSSPLQVHECHWVTPNGICGKKHLSYEDLMLHLTSHASSSNDTLPSPVAALHSNTPNLFTPQELSYKATLDAISNKDFSKSFSNSMFARYQPYSLPSRQLSVPFLH